MRKDNNVENIAIKYRIYPTDKQIKLICKTFGCCRKVWNLMLNNYQNGLGIITPAKYKDEYIYLKEVDSLSLCNVQMNLKQAIKNNKKNPKHFDKPKFKARNKCHRSYTTNNVKNNIELTNNYIKLPKLGNIKYKQHRYFDYKIKSVTISQIADKFYASVLFEKPFNEIDHTINETKAIGLDYKSNGFYVDSNNNEIGSPKYFRQSERKLIRQQRCLSRRVGSNKNESKSHNWLKQNIKVNRIHNHVANQRKDFAHKQSRLLINEYDIICLEDLNLKNIARSLKLGKSTNDNGFGMFRNFLEYKAKNEGKTIVYVDKFFPSSKLCHNCGYKKIELTLKDRQWQCPNCGEYHNRDYNSAINILNEGLRIYKNTLVGCQ